MLAALAIASSLLLPYFEASLKNPAFDTSFTVTDATAVTQIARVTVWTDRGMPVVWFPVALEGNQSFRISMHELLNSRTDVPVPDLAADNERVDASGCGARGDSLHLTPAHAIPNRLIPEIMASDARCMLTSGESSGVALPCDGVAGNRHAHAIGYVTVDAVRNCSLRPSVDPRYASEVLLHEAVLTGTFAQTAAGNVVASGALVSLDVLTSSMTIKVPAGATELHVWRAPAVHSGVCRDFAHAAPVVSSQRVRRRKVTIKSSGAVWIGAAKPSPRDPTAVPPGKCDPPQPVATF